MPALRRNLVPILVGVASVMVTIASLVVILDRGRDDRGPRGGDRGDGPFRVERQFGQQGGPRAFQVAGGALLGVSAQPRDGGLEVQSVLPGSPAERAGVRSGDVIIRADGREVRDVPTLRDAIARTRGQQYDLVVRRGGREQTLRVDGAGGFDQRMQPGPQFTPGQMSPGMMPPGAMPTPGMMPPGAMPAPGMFPPRAFPNAPVTPPAPPAPDSPVPSATPVF